MFTQAQPHPFGARWLANRYLLQQTLLRGNAPFVLEWTSATRRDGSAVSWEQSEDRPLAVVFKKELSDLLIRLEALPKSSGWQNTGELLWFRLKEEDLNNEFGDGVAGMVVYDGSDIESLHFRINPWASKNYMGHV